jgi:hypothetical protein
MRAAGTRRLVVVVAVVGIAVAAFFALHSGESSTKHNGEVTATIHVHDGTPAGGVHEVAAGTGQTLRMTVTSDGYRGEVHLHGYDVMREVAPGRPAVFVVRLTKAGTFEAELEATSTQIVSIEISP